MPQFSNYGPQTVSVNGAIVGPVRVESARTCTVQYNTGNFNGTIQFEQSIDGVNWNSCVMFNIGATGTAGQTSVGFTGTAVSGIFYGPCPGVLMRVRVTAYTAGSLSLTIGATELGIPTHSIGIGGAIAGANTPVDGAANPTNAVPNQSFGMIWNGSSWDRMRTGATSGTGSGALVVSTGNTDTLSLNNITGTAGIGTAVDMGSAREKHRITVLAATYGPTTSIRFEYSPDNINWVGLDVVVVPNASGQGGTGSVLNGQITGIGTYIVRDVPIRRARLNITMADAAMAGLYGWITST